MKSKLGLKTPVSIPIGAIITLIVIVLMVIAVFGATAPVFCPDECRSAKIIAEEVNTACKQDLGFEKKFQVDIPYSIGTGEEARYFYARIIDSKDEGKKANVESVREKDSILRQFGIWAGLPDDRYKVHKSVSFEKECKSTKICFVVESKITNEADRRDPLNWVCSSFTFSPRAGEEVIKITLGKYKSDTVVFSKIERAG